MFRKLCAVVVLLMCLGIIGGLPVAQAWLPSDPPPDPQVPPPLPPPPTPHPTPDPVPPPPHCQETPEPSTLVLGLIGAGVLGLGMRRRFEDRE